MDRSEAAGLGVAVAGHGALLAALALGFANAKLPPIQNDPIEVSFVDEVGLVSTAPAPSAQAAPKLAELEGPAEPEPLPLTEPLPAPAPAPVPQPSPVASKPVPRRPQPKAVPTKSAQPKANQPQRKSEPARGRLEGLLTGLSDSPRPNRSTGTPAKAAGPAVQASLQRIVRQQLKPHWRSPSGAEVELLKTKLRVSLSPGGAIVGEPRVVAQTGVTASNRSQAALHKEQAIKAVRLAAPFRLPAEYYDAWKIIEPEFDRRLSQ